MAEWYVYICEKHKRYYVGMTTDLAHRMRQHGVTQLLYRERCVDARGAARREQELKGWSRQKKAQLWRPPG